MHESMEVHPRPHRIGTHLRFWQEQPRENKAHHVGAEPDVAVSWAPAKFGWIDEVWRGKRACPIA
jgi:hypothetical protein